MIFFHKVKEEAPFFFFSREGVEKGVSPRLNIGDFLLVGEKKTSSSLPAVFSFVYLPMYCIRLRKCVYSYISTVKLKRFYSMISRLKF